MIKSFVIFALLATSNALDAMLTVVPNTVNTQSTLEMMISFDESLGKGGLISVLVPSGDNLITEAGYTANSLNHPLKFLPGSGLNCYSDDSSVIVAMC